MNHLFSTTKLSITKQALFFLFGLSFMLTSCSSNEEEKAPDVSSIDVNFQVMRVDKEMREFRDPIDVLSFMDANPVLASQYFKRGQYPDSVLARQILDFVTYEFNDTLFMDIDKAFGDLSEIEAKFTEAFKHLKYYYPDKKLPKIYTVATGFGNFGFGPQFPDLFFGKDMVVISLDFFCGEKSTYKPSPQQVPGYMLHRYSPNHIVPTVMQFLSQEFNKINSEDATLIAEMISYGKALEFTKKMMPALPDSLVIGYTQKELATAVYNQEDIYAHFVENNLFFETTQRIKQQYVDNRPKTTEIADICPGRIGWWLGWEIVKSYRKENGIGLIELMQNADEQKIFQESAYRPKKLEQ